MKQKVLKALANPPHIFYVPYSLAILNFLFWFLVFVVFMVIGLIFLGDIPMWTPVVFLGLLFISHSIFAIFSKQEPQFAQIIFSVIRIFKSRIPKRLAV